MPIFRMHTPGRLCAKLASIQRSSCHTASSRHGLAQMYQYALHWYMDLFQRALRDSEPDAENRDQRILNINDFFTYSLYKNVCRPG